VGFKVGIGGKIGPFRAGISTRGAGIGVGPFSVTTGRRRRRSSKSTDGPSPILVFVLFVALCPVLLLDVIGSAGVWALEIIWFALVGCGVALAASAKKRQKQAEAERTAQVLQRVQEARLKKQELQAAQAAEERAAREARAAELARLRAEMAATNEPWYDAAAGHYRHSTCTVKHRSAGAAGRCSSRI
jgi:hypothetical protein